ncbi:MAG: hypothetical protein ACLSVD_16780 [Eggerthellaceae bacterium]
MKINHAVLHVFDFVSCVNVFSQEELDLSGKNAKGFVTRHVRSALGNLDGKRGAFADDSMFAEELRSYFRGQRGFVDLSCRSRNTQLASSVGKAVSTDLLVVVRGRGAGRRREMADRAGRRLRGARKRYFALLLLESRQAFMHAVGHGGRAA